MGYIRSCYFLYFGRSIVRFKCGSDKCKYINFIGNIDNTVDVHYRYYYRKLEKNKTGGFQ